jgi:hypothetical protein
MLALTSKGLCRSPPETGRGTLFAEQWILAPFQGLLGLVSQLQVGLRHCGEPQRDSGSMPVSLFFSAL